MIHCSYYPIAVVGAAPERGTRHIRGLTHSTPSLNIFKTKNLRQDACMTLFSRHIFSQRHTLSISISKRSCRCVGLSTFVSSVSNKSIITRAALVSYDEVDYDYVVSRRDTRLCGSSSTETSSCVSSSIFDIGAVECRLELWQGRVSLLQGF